MANVKIQALPPRLIETSSIKLAHSSDLSFLHDLQRFWSKNLGYLHKTALSTLIESKCAWIIDENSEHAGYLLLYTQKQGILKVVQVAIDADLLRTTLGSELMETLIAAGMNHSSTTIRLNSRDDLPANKFWPTLGFKHTTTTWSKNKNHPYIFEWTLNLLTIDANVFSNSPGDIQLTPRKKRTCAKIPPLYRNKKRVKIPTKHNTSHGTIHYITR